MDLIVDANIVFAALIRDGATIGIFLEPELHLFGPEFLFDEIEKHKHELARKTRRGQSELEELLILMRRRITIVPKEEFAHCMGYAERVSPDPYDTVYLALAMRLEIPIWSNDKRLKEQDAVRVYSTKELLG